MTRRPVPLASIRKTQFAHRLTRGGQTARRECWGAETTDGLWDLAREDSPGTPWLIYHRPSVADESYTLPVLQCGTLRACRALVASGGAATELAVRKAEAAGWAYDSTRRAWCHGTAVIPGEWAEPPSFPPPPFDGSCQDPQVPRFGAGDPHYET